MGRSSRSGTGGSGGVTLTWRRSPGLTAPAGRRGRRGARRRATPGTASRLVPVGQGAEQAREGLIAFTDDRDVDAVDGTDQFGAHLAVEVGAAEHRHQVRMALLQPAGQRERRGVLLERRAEPGHGHLMPGKGVQHGVQVRGDVHVAYLEQLFPGLFRRLPQVRQAPGQFVGEMPITVGCRFREGGHREQPFAGHRAAMLAENLVVVHADPHGEIQVGMQRTDRETGSGGHRFEQPQLDRRAIRVHERHGDENHGEFWPLIPGHRIGHVSRSPGGPAPTYPAARSCATDRYRRWYRPG